MTRLNKDDPAFWVERLPDEQLHEYGWASQIVAEEFDAGLARWTSPGFVDARSPLGNGSRQDVLPLPKQKQIGRGSSGVDRH